MAPQLRVLLGRATAQVLADFRQDVYIVGHHRRATARFVIVCVMAVLVAVLAFFSWHNEPALRSSTVTYRVDRGDKIPSGDRILNAYCPCSKELLMWSDFVTWGRFQEPIDTTAVDQYCTQLRTNQARAVHSNSVVPATSIHATDSNGRHRPSPSVPPVTPAAGSPSPSKQATSPPAVMPPAVGTPQGRLPKSPAGGRAVLPSGLSGITHRNTVTSSTPSGTSTPSTSTGRRLLRATPTAPSATTPSHNTTAAAVQQARSSVLQQACSAWVQDVVISLNPTNLAYKVEAYQAAQLKPEESVSMLFRFWLGAKLKTHLQAQYQLAVTASVASTGSARPEPFPQLLAAAEDQISSMFAAVADEHAVSYPRYVKLCAAQHCDVVARKPAEMYVINTIAKLGGLWANVLLVALLLWRVCAVLPWVRREENEDALRDVVLMK